LRQAADRRDAPRLKAATSFSSSGKGKSKSEDGRDGTLEGVRSGPGSELSAAITQTQNMPASPPGFATVLSPIAVNKSGKG
jgi:hypothetical protein